MNADRKLLGVHHLKRSDALFMFNSVHRIPKKGIIMKTQVLLVICIAVVPCLAFHVTSGLYQENLQDTGDIDLAKVVASNGDLKQVERKPDFDEIVQWQSYGQLIGFERDDILSQYPPMAGEVGQRVRVIRYYHQEAYTEIIFSLKPWQLIAANKLIYRWVLSEKAAELDKEMGEYDPSVETGATTAACSSKFKFPYQNELPNKLTSYEKHCKCAQWAGDFNYGGGNDDCWLAVLNPARGIVISSGWINGYGWQVQMYHGSSYWTLVAHGMTDPNSFVRVGDDLLQGTFLMNRGASGGDWTCHTHLEFWKGQTSKPLDGFSCYSSVQKGGTYQSFQVYVAPPRGNP